MNDEFTVAMGLDETIIELQGKVAKMHNVSADELRTHRATLQKIAADLCDLNLGDDHG